MTWLLQPILIEGWKPMQMILELTFCILLFAVVNFSLKKAGMGIPKFWAGIGVLFFILGYLSTGSVAFVCRS